jgi:hypothetical protein
MKPISCLAVALTLVVASCGGSRAANCTEYAAEVRQQVERAESSEALMDWLQQTSQHAAELIQASPQQAQACADAILEATFGAAAMELESLLGE